MIIRWGTYRIRTDSRQWIMQEYLGTTWSAKGGTQERWDTWGYYGSLEELISVLPDAVLRRSNGNLEQAMRELRDTKTALLEALTQEKEDG